ncbi:MAG: GNAT family N-acetyltransferase [Pseudomonadales bacterium]|jgi:ribosomal protein S18 acetylase RimI-like enzyme|nr:GNAT family N-acetyltransferase [Pseudomonadales bacterium]
MTAPERIRLAKPDDLDVLLTLETGCFESDRISRRSFRRWLGGAPCIFLVAERGGEVTGYALALFPSGSRRLVRLYSLAVAPRARGAGIAGRLLRAVEEQARHAGRRALRLEVAASNQDARALYARAGYQPIDRRAGYYENGEDALVLERDLA